MIEERNIIFTTVHKIDRDDDAVELVEIANEDLTSYISGLMSDILNNVNYKHYKERRMTSEVLQIIIKSLEDFKVDDETKSNIAMRYLSCEQKGQERAKRMKVIIRRGFLIEALLSYNEGYYYFISKVEINDFLDEVELSKRQGMPFEDKALKTAIFVFDKDKMLQDILVTDKQNSVYWNSDFLEVDECSSNETSTKNLYTFLERKIRNGTSNSRSDYYALRNALITYFQAPRIFQYDEMEDIVFNKYTPDNPEVVDINKIKKAIEKEIKSKKYDTEFNIVPSAIKNKIKKNIRVNSFINLQLDGADENFQTMIVAFEENEKKYLKIETEDEAYNIFHR